MNDFEKLLVETGSEQLVLLYAKTYKVSEEFKKQVRVRFPERELLEMSIKQFLEKYATEESKGTITHLNKVCRYMDVETLEDLLSFPFEFWRFPNVGIKTLEAMQRALNNAGLDLKLSKSKYRHL